MAYKRKTNTPQRCYKFAVTHADIPQSMWDQCRTMQALWNRLCELHAAVRQSITDETTDEERKARWSAFDDQARAEAKATGLRHECDQDILDRFRASCRTAAKYPARGWPKPTRLKVSLKHRYAGGGAPVSTLMSSRSKRVRIDGDMCYPADKQENKRRRHAARRGKDSHYRDGVFLLNSGDEIAFTIQQHEPLNPEAIVKSVRWCGRFVKAFGWQYSLVIQTEEHPRQQRAATKRECGIDVGWRKVDAGLRVAYLVGDDGASEQIVLPFDFSTRDSRRDQKRRGNRIGWVPMPDTYNALWDLQEQRDRTLEDCKARVAEMVDDVPEWFPHARGRGLVKLMHELPDEHPARAIIASWKAADDPLFRRQSRAQNRFAARRRDLYSNIACRIAKRYDVIRIEHVGIANMLPDDLTQTNGDAEKKDAALRMADRYHQIAATADFLAVLERAAKKYGAKVVKHEPCGTSSTCSVCGGQFGTGPSLLQRCVNGHELDQDENAARNLLAQLTPVSTRRTVLRTKEEVAALKAAKDQRDSDK